MKNPMTGSSPRASEVRGAHNRCSTLKSSVCKPPSQGQLILVKAAAQIGLQTGTAQTRSGRLHSRLVPKSMVASKGPSYLSLTLLVYPDRSWSTMPKEVARSLDFLVMPGHASTSKYKLGIKAQQQA
eukprot:scaffold234855_cov19-Tisochrysis_lutea.AAC.1